MGLLPTCALLQYYIYIPTAKRMNVFLFTFIILSYTHARYRALVTYLHLPIIVQLFVRPIIAVTRVGNDLISGRTVHRGQFHATNGTTVSKTLSIYARIIANVRWSETVIYIIVVSSEKQKTRTKLWRARDVQRTKTRTGTRG